MHPKSNSSGVTLHFITPLVELFCSNVARSVVKNLAVARNSAELVMVWQRSQYYAYIATKCFAFFGQKFSSFHFGHFEHFQASNIISSFTFLNVS